MTHAETGFNLEINLSRESIEKVGTDPIATNLFLGGQGTAAKMVWDSVPPEVEPFSPDNLLIFSAGLLDATPVPGANRTSVSSISPQSNLYVNSGFAGFFGPELKQAGYDKIVIRGKASDLVYVWIHNDKVEIRNAGHLLGKSALETAALIQQELKDPNVQVVAIGMAGENRVYQATIDHANTSASRGVGAVMGDKRLKAIAVRGTKDITVARPAELFEMCSRQYEEIHDNPHCGDVFLTENDDSWHVRHPPWSGTRGHVRGYWSDELEDDWAVQISSEHVSYQWENYSQELEEVRETVVDKSRRLRGTGCFNCTKNCHEAIAVPGKPIYFLKNFGRLAYAMAAYDDLKLNYDLLAAMQNFGLDEFSMPQVFAFTVALYEAGIVTAEDLPEFPADNLERFSYLVDKVARREGLGDVLANGVYWAARHIGKGAEAYAPAVKKVEQVPLKMAMASYPYFLMYATGEKANITQIEGSFPQAPIPDRKERKRFVKNWDAAPAQFKQWFLEWEPGQHLSVEAAVSIVDWNEVMHYVDDALGICPLLSSFRGQFGGRPPYHLYNLPKFISLTTGKELDVDGLWERARRTRQLVRAINARRGLKRVDDLPTEDLCGLDEPQMAQQLLDAYYAFQGWTDDGIPSKETLDRFGLDYVSADFVKRGIL